MARSEPTSDADLKAFLSAHPPVASRSSIPDGTIVGKWRIAAFLGRGGTSEVFRAVHSSLPLAAALKILVRDNPSASMRFDRETQFLFENRDPHFPRFLGSGEYDGRPFVAVELLEPAELPHTDTDVEKYILGVAAGTVALHRKGLVHRDLKPQNVMRRKNGDLVIIDFGLVKDFSGATRSASPVSVVDGQPVGVGTPRFSAPEQFNGGEATPASDVHALGVLANECFDGFPPRCWAKIIRRATSSIPAQRYASVAEFMRAVRTRHRAGRAIAVALGIALATLAAAAWLHFRDSTTVADHDAFPPVMDLAGQSLVMDKPIVLKGGMTYFISGPGTLDADISGPTNTLLQLKNCVLLNRTKTLYPANGLKYRLEKGVYLNFPEIPEEPVNPPRRHFIEPFDGAFNAVVFGGPDSPQEFQRLRSKEIRRSLENTLRSEY